MGTAAWIIDAVAREAMLFAAVGFLIGGIDDLALDVVYGVRRLWRHAIGRGGALIIDELSPTPSGRRFAVFVPAWDEAAVIGPMIDTALARLGGDHHRLYVGCYPNDPATVRAVAERASIDPRVRLVVGDRPGPTTKADCLNTLWRALLRDDMADGIATRAVVLHDAEDVVHPHELRVFDALLARHALVQLPVLPLVVAGSPFVSGHYADEFAEAHTKSLVVRQVFGIGLPLAGVGCAIRADALLAVAQRRGGAPFDATSLTEDYELGLAVGELGGTACLARVREYRGGPLVAVRAYFPDRLHDAVVQKARWLTGIALAGWDRLGWARARHLGEHWMRMRDRRGPVAVLVLAAAYLALVSWAASAIVHFIANDTAPVASPAMVVLLQVNFALLLWRLLMRALFTGRAYGWRQAALSLPRAFVGNVIALLAVRRAVVRYAASLRGTPLRWDKTAHRFPDDVAQAEA